MILPFRLAIPAESVVKLLTLTSALRTVVPLLLRLREWAPSIVLLKMRFPNPVSIVAGAVRITASPMLKVVLLVLRLPPRLKVPAPSVAKLPTAIVPFKLVLPLVLRTRDWLVPTILARLSVPPLTELRTTSLRRVTVSLRKILLPVVVILPLRLVVPNASVITLNTLISALRVVIPPLLRVKIWAPLIVPFSVKSPTPVSIVVALLNVIASPRVNAVLPVVSLPPKLRVPVPSVVRVPNVAPAARVVLPGVVRVRLLISPIVPAKLTVPVPEEITSKLRAVVCPLTVLLNCTPPAPPSRTTSFVNTSASLKIMVLPVALRLAPKNVVPPALVVKVVRGVAEPIAPAKLVCPVLLRFKLKLPSIVLAKVIAPPPTSTIVFSPNMTGSLKIIAPLLVAIVPPRS